MSEELDLAWRTGSGRTGLEARMARNPGPPQTSSNRRCTRLLGPVLLALAILLTGACARPPNPPAPVLALPIELVPPAALGRVRVLLQSEFHSVTIEHSLLGGSLDVVDAFGRLALVDSVSKQRLEEATGFRFDPEAGRLITIDGVPYRGALEAFINPMGQPVVVNELPLEEYLRGVVPNELGPVVFPHLAALEAQSVAARTYAIKGRGRFAQFGFDLYPTERSQVYGGIASEHPLSDQAVRETAGVVALFEGQPIDAFYSSTCGGVTAAYSEVFLEDPRPYLLGGVPCPDEASRYHRWDTTISPQAIRSTLDAYAGVGRLRDLEILSRDATGRVTAMRFAGSAGEKILAGLDSRRALGLRSHFLDSLTLRRDADGFVTSVSIRGRGFGHGVGMCQIGAVAWAQRGRDFGTILQTYYPGVTIARLY